MENKMGNKIILLLIILSTVNLWGKNPFINWTENEVLNISEKVDLLVEGEVINVDTYYYNMFTKEILYSNEVTKENIGKLMLFTKVNIKILINFKNKNELKNKFISVWIEGGKFYLDDRLRHQNTTTSAYPFLDEGDIMIMGLNKNSYNTNYLTDKFEESISDYHFENEYILQIPSSENMIKEVEEGELEKSKEIVYKRKLVSLSESDSDEFPSYDDISTNFLEADILKEKNIKIKNNFVKKLKLSLGRKYE
jgi:hypothetical protein